MVEIALYQPDIPQNTGTILRFAACLGLKVHVIHPTGFVFSEKSFRRSAMDYADHVTLEEHDSFSQFDQIRRERNKRLVLMTTKATSSPFDFAFDQADIIMFGRESAGVPQSVAECADAGLRLPMRPQMRSLNVAMSCAMTLGEALRQTDSFPASGNAGQPTSKM